jgi:hypothetical protein
MTDPGRCPKRSEGDPVTRTKTFATAKKGVSAMKWHAINIYVKITTLMGAIAALLIAAGAEGKWC